MTRHKVCHNCIQRTYNCHTTCEMYINECKGLQKEKDLINKNKELRYQLDARESKIKEKVRKGHNKKYKKEGVTYDKRKS